MSQRNIVASEAKHGEKMIEVKVSFWTKGIASEPGKIVPKHALTKGVVRMESNQSHGIKPLNQKQFFYSLMDISAAIERVLIDHGIVLHPNRKMRKYLSSNR